MVFSPEILAFSAQYSTNRRPRFTARIGQLLGAPFPEVYLVAYAYLKWIDDVVDAPETPTPAALQFLERQRAILAGKDGRGPFRAPGQAERECYAEQSGGEPLGQALGEFLRSPAGARFAPLVEIVLDTLAFDARRKGHFVSGALLERRHRRLGRAALLFFEACLSPRREISAFALEQGATAYILLDTLLDLEEDWRSGFCNVPFHLLPPADLRDSSGEFLHTPAAFQWRRQSAERVARALDAFERELSKIRSPAFRLFCWQMVRSRRRKLALLYDLLALAGPSGRPSAVLLVGPTCSGKTWLAGELRERGQTVISFDQAYRSVRGSRSWERRSALAMRRVLRSVSAGPIIIEGAHLLLPRLHERLCQLLHARGFEVRTVFRSVSAVVALRRLWKRWRQKGRLRIVLEYAGLFWFTRVLAARWMQAGQRASSSRRPAELSSAGPRLANPSSATWPPRPQWSSGR